MAVSIERHQEYELARYKERRAWMIEYLGGKCVQCSTTEKLEFDHVDPKTKSFAVSENWSLSKELLITELDKCQLLCNSCHKAKSNSAYTVVHNRWRYQKHKCRCLVCKADYSKYRKKRYRQGAG